MKRRCSKSNAQCGGYGGEMSSLEKKLAPLECNEVADASQLEKTSARRVLVNLAELG